MFSSLSEGDRDSINDQCVDSEETLSTSQTQHNSKGDDPSAAASNDTHSCWIQWFVALQGNNFFCEVDIDYIQDQFNLVGLSSSVPYYSFCINILLDEEIPSSKMTAEQLEIIETAAEVLYGLIHARYICSPQGLNKMKVMFDAAEFGRCPRVYCQGQPVLPVGRSDAQRNYCAKVCCPNCKDIYNSKCSLDGAFFGTSFPHLFQLTFNDFILRTTKRKEKYVPRIFGFKIHKSSKYWLPEGGEADIKTFASLPPALALTPTEEKEAESTGKEETEAIRIQIIKINEHMKYSECISSTPCTLAKCLVGLRV